MQSKLVQVGILKEGIDPSFINQNTPRFRESDYFLVYISKKSESWITAYIWQQSKTALLHPVIPLPKEYKDWQSAIFVHFAFDDACKRVFISGRCEWDEMGAKEIDDLLKKDNSLITAVLLWERFFRNKAN